MSFPAVFGVARSALSFVTEVEAEQLLLLGEGIFSSFDDRFRVVGFFGTTSRDCVDTIAASWADDDWVRPGGRGVTSAFPDRVFMVVAFNIAPVSVLLTLRVGELLRTGGFRASATGKLRELWMLLATNLSHLSFELAGLRPRFLASRKEPSADVSETEREGFFCSFP